MKGLSAGLTFFNVATLCAILVGFAAGGLGTSAAVISLAVGATAAVAAYFGTGDPQVKSVVPESPPVEVRLSKRARRRLGKSPLESTAPRRPRYRSVWFWILALFFAIFAVRSFCWLLYIDGNDLKIQSVNNLGDLALHITYIRDFANGVPLWPDNPIYVVSKLRYPDGVDLFNSLIYLVHIDLIHGLVWIGLLASLATFYALYRWGGAFGVAGFLFNGGLAGFEFLNSHAFLDYQGDKTIAWKSIPLAMLVTQRGLLYAIPAGLLLLWHWREKFSQGTVASGPPQDAEGEGDSAVAAVCRRAPLPFWIEFSLYASMPLFHVHTFLALTIVLMVLFAFGDNRMRWDIGTLVAGAFLPATFFVWLITDHFKARSVLEWHPGWVQSLGDFAHPLQADAPNDATNGIIHGLKQIFDFWFINFGLMIPLAISLVVILAIRTWRRRAEPSRLGFPLVAVPLVLAAGIIAFIAPALGSCRTYLLVVAACALPLYVFLFLRIRGQWVPASPAFAFVVAALTIFLFAYLFKTAPWEWDNLKLILWAYLIVLPLLWNELIKNWPVPIRAALCVALFGSGFVTLFGGLATPGYGFATRSELDAVGVAVRDLPPTARFAAYPTYNHPLLLQGRNLVMGYGGHLWTQGFEYHEVEEKLRRVMQGAPNWRVTALSLGVRYIFWGREEKINYPMSVRPWENVLPKVQSGDWGAIYDLGENEPAPH